MKVLVRSLVILLTVSCVEQVDLEGGIPAGIVIEGNINNFPGPYTVKISRPSAQLDPDEFSEPPLITATRVVIVNDTDQTEEELILNQDGTYSSDPSFLGEIGKAYHLVVEIDNTTFLSSSETIPEPVPITNLEVVFDTDQKEEGVQVNIDFQEPADQKNYYQWKWVAHRQLFTYIPDPEPGEIPITCCLLCYKKFDDLTIDILDDDIGNGQLVRDKEIASFIIDRPTEHLVDVLQISISKNYFEFLRQVKAQVENTGGLFDAPPFRIVGNIKRSDNLEALGYFSATGITEAFTQFNGAPMSINVGTLEEQETDCRVFIDSDTIPPKNWTR